MAFVRTREPVDFGAMDGRSVDLFFALAGPTQDRREYLAILARLAYLLRMDVVRDGFRKVEETGGALALVRKLSPQSVSTS